jgi:transposase
VKLSIVGGDRWKKVERFGRELQKVCQEKTRIFAKLKSDLNPSRRIWKDTWKRSTYFRGGTLRRKFKEEKTQRAESSK